jgi:hypothetical protein
MTNPFESGPPAATRTSPQRRPYGLLAGCADDQGAAFRLWQPAG